MEHGESISDKLLGPSTRMPGSVWKDAAKAAGAVESAGEQGSGGAGTTAKEPEPAGRGGGLAALEDGRRIRRVLQALEVSIMDRLRILGRMRAAMGRIPGSGGVSPTDVRWGCGPGIATFDVLSTAPLLARGLAAGSMPAESGCRVAKRQSLRPSVSSVTAWRLPCGSRCCAGCCSSG